MEYLCGTAEVIIVDLFYGLEVDHTLQPGLVLVCQKEKNICVERSWFLATVLRHTGVLRNSVLFVVLKCYYIFEYMECKDIFIPKFFLGFFTTKTIGWGGRHVTCRLQCALICDRGEREQMDVVVSSLIGAKERPLSLISIENILL